MTRFDYVEFDDFSDELSQESKEKCKAIEYYLQYNFRDSREKECALTKLEECFMWIGKAIKEDQNKRRKLNERND